MYSHMAKDATVLRNRVKDLRSRLEMRQVDLAEEVGVTRQTVIAIEKGRLNPSIKLSLRLARVLREPTDYVFYLDPDAVDKPTGKPGAPRQVRVGNHRSPGSVSGSS